PGSSRGRGPGGQRRAGGPATPRARAAVADRGGVACRGRGGGAAGGDPGTAGRGPRRLAPGRLEGAARRPRAGGRGRSGRRGAAAGTSPRGLRWHTRARTWRSPMSPELLDWAIALGTGGVAALAGWPLTRLALHLAAGRDRARAQLPAEHEELETAAQETADDGAVAGAVTQEDLDPTPAVDDDGLLRGGLWIGLLERLIIAGGVALG